MLVTEDLNSFINIPKGVKKPAPKVTSVALDYETMAMLDTMRWRSKRETNKEVITTALHIMWQLQQEVMEGTDSATALNNLRKKLKMRKV